MRHRQSLLFGSMQGTTPSMRWQAGRHSQVRFAYCNAATAATCDFAVVLDRSKHDAKLARQVLRCLAIGNRASLPQTCGCTAATHASRSATLVSAPRKRHVRRQSAIPQRGVPPCAAARRLVAHISAKCKYVSPWNASIRLLGGPNVHGSRPIHGALPEQSGKAWGLHR